jgi:putative proteasome-type protease
MTYCVALRLDTGMIFASDSRTNAGVDHIATFTKMRVYEKKDDRVIVTLSSGNLAMTQGVINILDRHSKAIEGEETIWTVESMYDAAALVGDALREMHRRDGPFLSQSSTCSSAARSRAKPRAFSIFMRRATSSRPPMTPPTSSWANPSTASRSSTA